MSALRQAVVCSCLAQAGPQRSRMLATLVKDERTAQLPEHPMLESMFKDRLLERWVPGLFLSAAAFVLEPMGRLE